MDESEYSKGLRTRQLCVKCGKTIEAEEAKIWSAPIGEPAGWWCSDCHSGVEEQKLGMTFAEMHERLKNLGLRRDPIRGVQHELIKILKSMRVILQQHEVLLICKFKTLNMDYHNRADKISEQLQVAIEEDSHKEFLSPDERLVRIKRFGREAKEAMRKLKKEFNFD